jgi:DNA-binding response OmpR family regulator
MSRPDSVRVHVLSSDERIREAARALPSNYSVSFSTDKWEGIHEIARNAEIAVIELDPGGFGVTKEIRERSRDRKVRVIMICSRPHDRWLCKQAGADEVLVKPLSDISQLTRAITS